MNDLYNEDERETIKAWLESIGCAEYATDEDVLGFEEYVPGQLLSVAKGDECDSIADWDRWQDLQKGMQQEVSFADAMYISTMLWENDIEVMELNAPKENIGTPEDTEDPSRFIREMEYLKAISHTSGDVAWDKLVCLLKYNDVNPLELATPWNS